MSSPKKERNVLADQPFTRWPLFPRAKFSPAAQFRLRHCHAKVSKNFEKGKDGLNPLCPKVIMAMAANDLKKKKKKKKMVAHAHTNLISWNGGMCARTL